MKADDFDRSFDESEDVTDVLDQTGARRPGQEARRVNIDFPAGKLPQDKGRAAVDSRASQGRTHEEDDEEAGAG